MKNDDLLKQHGITAPNLKGDDVPYVRKDANGKIISHGIMNRKHIADEAATGSAIEEVAEPYVPPLPDSDPDPDAIALQAVHAANIEFQSSDRYFLSDALNYIDKDKQKQWEEYRKSLHNVIKSHGKSADVLQALPGSNPDGIDKFTKFRKKTK